jgi:hypothetical protein
VNDKDETVGFNAMGQEKTAETKANKESASTQSVPVGKAQVNSGGGTMAGVDKPSKGNPIGKVLNAGAGFAGLGGAVGMQAVGQGTVSQNMSSIKPMGQKKFTTTKRTDMYDEQRKAEEYEMGKSQGLSQSPTQVKTRDGMSNLRRNNGDPRDMNLRDSIEFEETQNGGQIK